LFCAGPANALILVTGDRVGFVQVNDAEQTFLLD